MNTERYLAGIEDLLREDAHGRSGFYPNNDCHKSADAFAPTLRVILASWLGQTQRTFRLHKAYGMVVPQ